jgi:hypothetical protein
VIGKIPKDRPALATSWLETAFIIGKDLQVSVIDFGLAACSFDINPYLPPNAENKCSEKEAFQRLREFVGTTVVVGTRGES